MYNTDKQQNECSDHGTYLFLHLFSFFRMLCVHVFVYFCTVCYIPAPLFFGGGEGGKRGMGWDGV